MTVADLAPGTPGTGRLARQNRKSLPHFFDSPQNRDLRLSWSRVRLFWGARLESIWVVDHELANECASGGKFVPGRACDGADGDRRAAVDVCGGGGRRGVLSDRRC